MKKIITTAAALVLTLAMSVTAFAAPSVTAPSNTTASGSSSVTNVRNFTLVSAAATDANGNAVDLQARSLTAAEVAAAEAAVKAEFGENVDVLAAGDYNVDGASESNPITVVFNVNGVKAGEKVYVLHQHHDGKWYRESATAADGKVTAVFTSFSPMVIVRESAAAVQTGNGNGNEPGSYDKYLNGSTGSTGSAVSPKTGDNGVTGAALLIVVCAAAFVVLGKKKTV